MNQGLRLYSKLITHTIGRCAQTHINIQKQHANFHMIIPIYEIREPISFEVWLCYTYTDRLITSEFGKGVRLNYYRTYQMNGNFSKIEVTYSDGSKDEFNRVGDSFEYYSIQQQASILVELDEEEEEIVRLIETDEYGNQRLTNYGNDFPYEMKFVNGDELHINSQQNQVQSIENDIGDRVEFHYINNQVYQISIKKNGVVIYNVTITYDTNQQLRQVLHKKMGTTLYLQNYMIGTNTIQVIDELSTYRIRYHISQDRIVSWKEGHNTNLTGGIETLIQYEDFVTNVIDYKGRVTQYYFDQQGYPTYELYEEGVIRDYRFETTDPLKPIVPKYVSNIMMTKPVEIASYNIIQNGYFTQGFAFWTSSDTQRTSIVTDATNPIQSILGNQVLRMIHAQGSAITVFQDIMINGLPTDAIGLSYFTKDISGTTGKAILELWDDDEMVECVEAPFDAYPQVTSPWSHNTIACVASKPYQKIRIQFEVSSQSIYHIDGVIVKKTPLSKSYQYSDEGNLVQSNISHQQTNIAYTGTNDPIPHLPKQVFGPSSELIDLEYDEAGNMTKATSAYEVEMNVEYNEYHQPTKTSIISDQDKIEQEVEYTSGGYLFKTLDPLLKQVSYVFDETFGTLLEFTNGVQTKTSYQYDSWDRVIQQLESKQSESTTNEYTYYKDIISGIQTSNQLYYKIQYDSDRRLRYVYVGKGLQQATNKLIEQQYVNQSSTSLPRVPLVEKRIYGNNQDTYLFVYDAYDRLIEIKLKLGSSTTYVTQYTYQYNSLGQLIRYDDVTQTTHWLEYIYNDDQLLKQVTDHLGSSITYGYDNLNHVIIRTYQDGQKVEVEQTSYPYRSRGINPQAVYQTIQSSPYVYSGFFNERVYDEIEQVWTEVKSKALVGMNAIQEVERLEPTSGTNLTVVYDQVIPTIFCDESSERLSYPMVDPTFPALINETVGFWFKTQGTYINRYLFSAKNSDGFGFIGVYINTYNKIVVKLITNQNIVIDEFVVSNEPIKVNDWNFFSLTWYNKDHAYPMETKSIYELSLNGEYVSKVDVPRIDLELYDSPVLLHIGGRWTQDSYQDRMNMLVTGILVSKAVKLPRSMVDEYYHLTKEYIAESVYVDGDLKTVSSSSHHCFEITDTEYNQYEIFPLNQSVESIKQHKPSRMALRTTGAYDRDRMFNYNTVLKRYFLVCSGNELIYEYSMNVQGTIGMKAFIKETNPIQYFVQSKDENQNVIGLYRKTNYQQIPYLVHRLYLEVNQTSYDTMIEIENDSLVDVSMTWHQDFEEVGLRYTFYIRVGTQSYQVTVPFVNELSGTMKVSIGRRLLPREELIEDEEPIMVVDALHGQIEMLLLRNAYTSPTIIQSMWTKLTQRVNSKQYDTFGRLRYQARLISNTVKTEQTYDYHHRVGEEQQTSLQIKQEQLMYQNQLNPYVIKYDYNGSNHVSRVEKTKEGTTEETFLNYNYKGYLTAQYSPNIHKTYLYDQNGNITQIANLKTMQTTTLSYDTLSTGIWADRLMGVGSKEIKYDSKYLGNPKYYGTFDQQGNLVTGITYSWEGRRLVRYQNTVGNQDISYRYQDRGIRIEKNVNGTIHQYWIDGTNIIKEVVGSVTYRYHYDEAGQVDSITKKDGNNQTTYFYIRNILGEIIGITNEAGELVVEYIYDAWGNIEGITGSQAGGIGQENPFRYKGYYYDAETGLYYCNSRYYNPEWGRWLSADDVSYLDAEDINGLNLYAYCGNNPVMGYDPNGTIDWKKVFGYTAAFGLAALTVTAVIASGGTLLVPALIGFGIGSSVTFLGHGIGNALSGENFFKDMSVESIVMGGLAGAAFATGVGGLWGAIGIGALSNAGTSALEDKSWGNIILSGAVGGIAAGLGYSAGKLIGRAVFGKTDLLFKDVYQLALLDTNKFFAATIAFRATYYTFAPTVTPGIIRGATKFLGNRGISFV